MSKLQSFEKSINAINKNGLLLVFPVKNANEPRSIWSELYPRTEMIWSWDDTNSKKVHDTWILMKRLSDCRKVIYSKWYQGRATFFSIELFTALVAKSLHTSHQFKLLSSNARQILEALEMDSPLSTKELKAVSELQGRYYEGTYNKALRELFQRFLIVGYGEVDDGAFPSAAMAATKTIYEDIYEQACNLNLKKAQDTIDKYVPTKSKFRQFYDRTMKSHFTE